MQESFINYALGADARVGDKIDVGLRASFLSPIALSFKYQFLGEPATRAEAGNFSLAAEAQPGILIGGSSTGAAVFYSGELTVLAGYRAWDRHLFILSPFFGFAGLTGYGAGTDGAGDGSGLHYGVGLGYEYDFDALFLRVEETWSMGTWGADGIFGFYTGGTVGIRL